jgi:hypothetical protein
MPDHTAATAVYINAEADFDTRLDDEVLVFSVYVGDDDAEIVGKVYTCSSENSAWNLAEKIARDRRLALVGPAD